MKMSMIRIVKCAVAALLCTPLIALAADAGVALDKAPLSTNQADLQNGAKTFLTYCFGCHSASFMRYNMLTQLGWTDKEIEKELIVSGEGAGALMTIAMKPKEAKTWFGVTPPDLTLVARQRASSAGSGADWLYTYLRAFYRDAGRPTGWNNKVFENAAMPHVLWQLQGEQEAEITEDEQGVKHVGTLKLAKPGTLSPEQYDKTVADLVSFIDWMGEPGAQQRKSIGVIVLAYLAFLFVLCYFLKKNFWKDVH